MPKFAGDVKLGNRMEPSVRFSLLCNGKNSLSQIVLFPRVNTQNKEGYGLEHQGKCSSLPSLIARQ